MIEQLKLKLNDSKATRWGALVIVAFTMMAAYYCLLYTSDAADE